MMRLDALRTQRVAEVYASQSKLAALLLSVAPEADYRPAPNEWSYAEIAAHMMTVEIECWWHRTQRILTEDVPEFDRYYLNSGWDFSAISLTDAVADWVTWRKRVVTLIETLDDEQMLREGAHVFFGRISPLDILKLAVDHDAEHYLDLQKMKSSQPLGTTTASS